jgi:hypothetical protein
MLLALRFALLIMLGIAAGIDQWHYRSGRPLPEGITPAHIVIRLLGAALFVVLIVWPFH